jgi:drug/metabolite transporter (DMT)-like permease
VRRPGRPLLVATFALLTVIWGTTWAAIRVSLQGIPPFTGVAVRFGVAAVLLLAAMRLFGIRFAGTANERRVWLLNTALSFCASYGVVYWCEQYVPSGLASVLFATFPLFVALLAHVALPGDRLTRGKAAGILVGFAGVAVIFSEDFTRLGGPHVALASAVMLASPMLSACASVGAKRWGGGVHPFSMTAVPMAGAAVVMGGLAAVVERGQPVDFGPGPVAAMLYLAFFGSAVTFTLYYWLMSHIAATRLSLIAYSTPIVAVVVGVLVMHEPVTTRMVTGALLVIAGVAVAVRPTRSMADPARPALASPDVPGGAR